jgi:hypothetical protein
MLEILKGIEAVASDLRWLPFGGSYGGHADSGDDGRRQLTPAE